MPSSRLTRPDRPSNPPLARSLTGSHPGLANTEPQNLLFVSLGRRFFPQYPPGSMVISFSLLRSLDSPSHPPPPLRFLAFIARLCVKKRPPSFLSVGFFRPFSGRIFTETPIHSIPPTRYAPFFSCTSVPHTPFTTLRSPPSSRQKPATTATNGTEIPSYIIIVLLSVPVCSVTAAQLSLNLRNLPKLSSSLLAKLHIPTFALYFFHYPFPALISLRRTPNGRISGRFASQYPSHGFDIEMMKACSLLRSISGHPSPPSHAPSFSGSRGPCRWSRSPKVR